MLRGRSTMLERRPTFVANHDDNLHCFQACLQMAWDGLRGEPLGDDEADRITGFVAGRETWSFAGMLAAADAGIRVTSIEDFDPVAFVANPVAELTRQVGRGPELRQLLEASPIQEEAARAQACIDHPGVSFQPRTPTALDLVRLTSAAATAVVCNVNAASLSGARGYASHFVLVDSVDGDEVVLQNPGLPPLEDQHVPAARFLAAWRYPRDSMANILAFSCSSVQPK
ncbi:MAG: hypothetical protein QOJ89_3969 [bacterium]